MAVYTEVREQALLNFLSEHDCGNLISFSGIPQGVENTNYIVNTSKKTLILTLYERRTKRQDLPFFLGLMRHLAAAGFTCPTPQDRNDGLPYGDLCGRPAALFSYIDGKPLVRPNEAQCRAVGRKLAEMHTIGSEFRLARPNSLDLESCKALWAKCAEAAQETINGIDIEINEELKFLCSHWPANLPKGIIHGDLFPDNVLFYESSSCGIIDFYFACNEMLAYDLGVCINAWCFSECGQYNRQKGSAILEGYQAIRPLAAPEVDALPILMRGSALRFFLTRLEDQLLRAANVLGERKDPNDFLCILRSLRSVESMHQLA